jgi:hypothetical protein
MVRSKHGSGAIYINFVTAEEDLKINSSLGKD